MIVLDIRQPNKLPGLLSIFVDTGGYNLQYIEVIKTLPNRNYDPETKLWEVPIDKLPYLVNAYKTDTIKIKYTKEQKYTSKIPKGFQFKTSPYEFQLDGIEYGLNHDKFINADQPGLGKSLQSICIADIRMLNNEVHQCLVVCGVNTLKSNWLNEINMHSYNDAFILGTRYRVKGANKSKPYIGSMEDKISDVKSHTERYLITNIETLRNDKFIDTIRKKCPNIDMIIFDEFHHCNSPTSAQSRGLQKLQDYPYKICLTGTPILNRPTDCYIALRWLDLEKSNYDTFKKYYCIFDKFGNHTITGYKNLDTLRHTLQSCMIRRRKTDVLDLPPLTEQIQYIELSDNEQKIYDGIREGILKDLDLIIKAPNPLTKLLRLRQATGYTGILSETVKESTKIDRCYQLAQDITANGDKVIFVSNWTSITNPLLEKLKEFNPAEITGEVKDSEREAQKQRFQNDPNCKVLVATIGACGTGLTLTAANYIVFLDLPWTYANYEQARDRIYRIGSIKNMTVIILMAKGTIDERVWETVQSKKELSDQLIDGKVPKRITKDDLLKLLN